MQSITRQFGFFLLVLLAMASLGCSSAVDESLPTSDEATASTAEALMGEAALAEDCEQAALSSEQGDYEELSSIMSLDDGSPEAALSGCRRYCNCCKGGNRFCCKHCKFCSGPIGPYGVSTNVLAQ